MDRSSPGYLIQEIWQLTFLQEKMSLDHGSTVPPMASNSNSHGIWMVLTILFASCNSWVQQCLVGYLATDPYAFLVPLGCNAYNWAYFVSLGRCNAQTLVKILLT